MKNILFVQPYASQVGGVDTVLLQLIEGLDKSRYRCFVLLSAPTDYVRKYEQLGVTVLFGPLAVFGKPTDLGYYFRNMYILLKSMKAIKGIVRKYRIDLIHSHKMEVIGANLIGKWLGIPTVQTVHELARKPLVAYKFVAYLNHLFNDKVIVLCDRSKIMFRWFNRESNKLVKIYNGITKSAQAATPIKERLREQLGLLSGDRIAITIARLSPMKGLEYLIEAAAKLKQDHPDIKFVIVGDVAFEHEKAYKDQLLSLIRRLGVEQTVFMLGLRRDVPDLLEQSDVLILPSVYDIFPTVILEAMSKGLPVVATDVGGVPEMVKGNTGIMVSPCNSDALKTAIVRMFAMDYQAMGVQASKLYSQEFTREHYVSRTVAVYEEMFRTKLRQASDTRRGVLR
ncbi:glycosyltransferase family 4 protein [Cohnella mopanensis]|uniref:glycosyltransferase family 4 protein n=1 Tax=Cohnella mopanensis TaxID=2911966 RepID=UPI001EF75D37|nr:glycosyltransferase family 4 protein [Cohnella mopanensis]